MRYSIILVAAAAILLGVEDPWAKVRDLKSGAELRIIKRGAARPVLATFDQLTDEKLVVATKTEQIAISRDEIDRIDYRPASAAKGVKVESSTRTREDPSAAARPQPYGSSAGTRTVESTTNIGSNKPDFETIYRRTVTLRPPPKK